MTQAKVGEGECHAAAFQLGWRLQPATQPGKFQYGAQGRGK
jgi:hypothetical protein